MDRDEPRFAQATWEMIERGDWFIPYFNGQYRFDKPVLAYWWMRIHDVVLGKTELASRLHSVVASVLTALVIFEIGAFLFSRQAGFWAGAGWLSCFQVLIHGRLCVADLPLLLGVTVACWGLFRLLLAEADPPRWGKWFWVLAGGLAFGFLAKGPVALAVPLLAVLLARFAFHREAVPWRRCQPVSLAVVVLAAVGLWGIPALVMTQGKFWEVGMGEHVVERGLGAFNGRLRIPVVYYLFTALLSLWPWSTVLPAAWPRPGAGRKWGLAEALLLGWGIGPVLVFSLYATQLPHYILPGFPAFFLLLFRSGDRGWAAVPGKWFWGLLAAISLPALAVAAAAASIPVPADAAPVRGIVVLGALLFPVLGSWVVLARFGRWKALGAVLVAAAGITVALAQAVRSVHPTAKILAAWDEMGGMPEDFRAWRYQEPSLVFYAGPPWWFGGLPDQVGPLAAWVAGKPDRGARGAVLLSREWRIEDPLVPFLTGKGWVPVADQDHREALAPVLGSDRLQTRTVTGINVARASWVELVVCAPRRGED
jgi:4-amino-4-deoxy-L-arabinose transferase-like glycosyltransferase